MLLFATSQGKSTTSGGIILDRLDENKIRDRELLYKYQPRLEKRHEQLKTVYNVTPFWLNSVTRIEAFLFLYFVALLVQSIIERAVRQSMERNGFESIPIYPESRECHSPTTDRILGLFENVHYHDLIRNGIIIQTFQPQLSEIQQLVLKLLDIPVEVYQKI